MKRPPVGKLGATTQAILQKLGKVGIKKFRQQLAPIMEPEREQVGFGTRGTDHMLDSIGRPRRSRTGVPAHVKAWREEAALGDAEAQAKRARAQAMIDHMAAGLCAEVTRKGTMCTRKQKAGSHFCAMHTDARKG